MKKVGFLFFVFIACCNVLTSTAADVIRLVNNINYKIVNNEAYVIKIDNNTPYSGNIIIPSAITYDGDKTATVTRIDRTVFQNCSLTLLELPATLNYIFPDAFKSCTIGTIRFASWNQLCAGITYENANANPLPQASHLYFSSDLEHEVSLTQWVIPEEITTINNYAFYGMTGITSVQLPTTLNEIGQHAFSGCSGLTEITIPQSVSAINSKAFNGCTGLTKVTYKSINDLCNIAFGDKEANPLYYAHHLYFGDNTVETSTLSLPNISAIGTATFAGGSEILSVTIPATVTSFGADAFNGCTKLQSASFTSQDHLINMTYANETASPLYYAQNVMVNGNSITQVTLDQETINANLFANASWLKKVTFGSNVRNIGKAAFSNCTKLETVELNEGIVTIGNDAFKNCRLLESITLPSTLQSIGESAFNSCYKLKNITIPASVTTLANQVFIYCSGLKTAKFLTTNIDAVPSKFFYGCSGLETIELSSTITTIGSEAFRGCSSLTGFPTGGAVSLISNSAFVNCNAIQTLELPFTIRQINQEAFSSCTGLTELIINDTRNDDIINLGANVFLNCDKLQSVYSSAINAPNADQSAFGNRTDIKLYLAQGVNIASYNTTPWTDFGTPITISNHTIKYYVDGDSVYCDTINTGDYVIPYVLDVRAGWIFSGWQEEIPTVMPDNDIEIHGFYTKKQQIGDFYYLLDPVKEEATVIHDASYSTMEEVSIPSTVQFTSEHYDHSNYSVVAINALAFDNCVQMRSIEIPASIKRIGNQAFSKCSELMAIELPASVTVLSDSLFYGCTNLIQVTMGSAVTEIGASAFNNCNALYMENLPSQLQKIGSLAFCNCRGLRQMTIPASVTEFGERVFQGCTTIETVNFDAQNKLTSLPNSTFQNCYKLKSFTLAPTMKYIEGSAFYNCGGLEIVEIPEGVLSVSSSAFNGCQNLKKVIIPESVNTLGGGAFINCSKIRQVTVKKETAPIAAIDIFDTVVCDSASLYVPNKTNYQSKSPWSSFKNIIERKQHTLKYEVDGKQAGEVETKWTGDGIVARENPVKTGHKFSGWKGLPTTMPDSNVVVTGNFQYYITYKTADKDSLLHVDSLYYGAEVKKPAEIDSIQYIYELDQDLPTMPAEDITVKVTYLRSECEYTVNDIRYYLYTKGENKHAEVMPGKTTYNKQNVVIPSAITYETENIPVTVIQDNAFKNCNNLLTVTLPNTLQEIGVQAFGSCNILKEITIPENVSKLGAEAFMYCSGLKTADIQTNHIDTLPSRLFSGCTRLETVNLSSGIKVIGAEDFRNCSAMTTFPTGGTIKEIFSSAFAGCKNIQTLELPATIRQIYKNAFSGCTGLTELIINNTDNNDVIIIEENVFDKCDSLHSVYSLAQIAPHADPTTFGGRTDILLFLDENVDKTSYNEEPWTDFGTPITIADHTIKYYVDGDSVYCDHFNTGENVTPYELTLREGWIFSGWQEKIPSVMPNEDLQIHGFYTKKEKIGNFRYLLNPVNKEATVIADESYRTMEDVIIPAAVTFESEDYDISNYTVAAINTLAFDSCAQMRSIEIPASIKRIGNQAFSRCTNLTEITLPANVTVLSDSLFYNCTNLISVTMEGNVTEIGASAFNNCRSLNIENLPSQLKKIGSLAFCYCNGLHEMTIPASVTEMGERVFQNCEGLETVIFDANSALTSLPNSTFQNCYSLKNFTLAPSMKYIQGSAFINCRNLELVSIPSGITNIYSSAFGGCQNLKRVIIPVSVASIGSGAFKSCPKIEQVTVNNETAPSAAYDIFDDDIYTKATLYVPQEDSYKAHSPWKSFEQIVVRQSRDLTYMVDGTQYRVDTYQTGDAIEAPTPTKEGHQFSGWKDLPTTMPNKNIVVTGAFEYSITYRTNDEKDSLLHISTYFYGDSIKVPAEIDSLGYAAQFDQELITMPANDVTLKVTYVVAECELTHNDIRYFLYTQPKNGIEPHAEVMPGEKTYSQTSITLPANIAYMGGSYPVTVIRNDAFKNSKNLQEIRLPANLKAIGTQAFRDCAKLKDIEIPASVDSLGNEVFMYCYNLESVTFQGTALKRLPGSAFLNCTALKDIELPTSLTTIGSSAFAGCKSLPEIVFPNSLQTIKDRAFAGCEQLDSIYIHASATACPAAEKNTFDSLTYINAMLFIPNEDILTDPWVDFVNIEPNGGGNVQKCATPTISYIKGQLKFECETPGASFVSDIKVADASRAKNSEKDMTQQYEISVYTTCKGYKRSDTATAFITWCNGKPVMTGFKTVELIPDPLKGDMDGNGMITIFDAVSIVNIILNQGAANSRQASKVNDDDINDTVEPE